MQTRVLNNAPRRRWIGLVGGGIVVAAGGSLAACSSTYPDDAVRAWQPIGDAADVRRWALAHGLLAPNPHNRQPWIADLRRDDEVTLICDPDRLLPATDPYGRQILVGCGAFIELAVIAAAERGYRVTVEPFPAGAPGPTELPGARAVARLSFARDGAVARDPLFAQIRRRHTNKSTYESARSVPDSVWQSLKPPADASVLLAGSVTDPKHAGEVRQILRASWEVEVLTPRTYLESARLLRIGPTEIEQRRDGISLVGTMPRLLSAVGLFDRFEVPVRGSSNFARVMDRWVAFETGSGYFWIATRGNARTAQLAAGRAYVRAHLNATAAGVDMHPLSQALQEFPELETQYRALHRLLGFEPPATTVQMLARVGYGTQAVGGSPRRELAQLIRA